MGYWRQDVEGFSSLGSHGRVGQTGSMQIQGKIVRYDPSVENIIEQVFVAGTKHDVVVEDPWKFSVGTKIHHKKGHRMGFTRELFSHLDRRSVVAEQFSIGLNDVAVGDDHIKTLLVSVVEADSCDLVVFGQNGIDPCIGLDGAADLPEKTSQSTYQGVGAPFGPVNPLSAFEGVDQRVDGRGAKRMAPDQEAVEAEGLPDFLTFKKGFDL